MTSKGISVFDRLTADVRRALILAQEEAAELGHGALGAEHLLLGTLGVDGPAAELLSSYGVTASAARDGVVDLHGRGGRERKDVYHLPFTEETRDTLNEAGRYGKVDVPVLALCLLHQASVRQLLLRCGADPGELEQETAQHVTPPELRAGDDPLPEIRAALGSLRGEVAALRAEIRELRESIRRP